MAEQQLFTGLVFVVEPIAGIEDKAAKVKKSLSENGGVISRIVTDQVSRSYKNGHGPK